MISSSSICLVALARVTTISRVFFYFYQVMGRKTKMERVLEKDICDLEKNSGGQLRFYGVLDIFLGTRSRKCEF